MTVTELFKEVKTQKDFHDFYYKLSLRIDGVLILSVLDEINKISSAIAAAVMIGVKGSLVMSLDANLSKAIDILKDDFGIDEKILPNLVKMFIEYRNR